MNVNEYITLIEKFLTKEISRKEFKHIYLNKFKAESLFQDDEVFELLDTLFAAADLSTDYQSLLHDGSGFYINEDQLRQEASEILEGLRKYAA